jgi:uncharacterized protein YecT (DUF1311 family)
VGAGCPARSRTGEPLHACRWECLGALRAEGASRDEARTNRCAHVKQSSAFPYLIILLAILVPCLCAQGVDCNSPKSTYEQTYCAGQELTVAETDLEQAFADALQQYSGTTDKWDTTLPKSELREQRQYEAKMRKALIASQKACVQYRAAACMSVAAMYDGGTITPSAVASCQAALTSEPSSCVTPSLKNDQMRYRCGQYTGSISQTPELLHDAANSDHQAQWLSSRLIPHRHCPGAELQSAHEPQVDMLR